MECPKCGLNNMPGSTTCFQCGANFTENRGTIITFPPRSKKSGIKQSLQRYSGYNRLSIFKNINLYQNNFFFFLPHMAKGFLSVIIPGFPQYLNRQLLKGLFFTSLVIVSILIWLFCFINYFQSFPSFSTILPIFLIFLTAIFDGTFFSIPEDIRKNFQIEHYLGLLAFISAGLFLCFHILFLPLNNRFIYFTINQDFPISVYPFNNGDKVIGRKDAYNNRLPERGDIVFYNNNFIGKIIGLPSESIIFEKNKIFINDEQIFGEIYYLTNPNDVNAWEKSLNNDKSKIIKNNYYLAISFGAYYQNHQFQRQLIFTAIPKNIIKAKCTQIVFPKNRRKSLYQEE
ncbi:MAG: hypothetical protein HQK79_06230 [Desulfobacterales bacterium]|nr:hypothetical protein [Desulfobacterales bacterium]MBF0397785.1 hypothetical protein [Desulfobacterales bacterium]